MSNISFRSSCAKPASWIPPLMVLGLLLIPQPSRAFERSVKIVNKSTGTIRLSQGSNNPLPYDSQISTNVSSFPSSIGKDQSITINYTVDGYGVASDIGGMLAIQAIRAMSYLYIGRIEDIVGNRDQALRHYQLALEAGDPSERTREMAERGLEAPFSRPGREPTQNAPEQP